MSDTSRFELIVIGAGQAGPPLARDFAKLGKRVALIERSKLGGSCINYGCTPTKDVIAAAKLAHDARRASEFGIRIPEVHVDFKAVLGQARKLVQEEVTSLDQTYGGVPNLRLVRGSARLDGRDESGALRVRVGSEVLTGANVVLDTGTRSFIPEVEGLDPNEVLCAENWLGLEELPKRIVFLGSGYIGLEMGQFFRRMGAEVTLIESSDRIIRHEDPDVSAAIQKFMEEEGIEFKLDTHLKKVEGKRGDYRFTLTSGELRATHLFIATGRVGQTAELGLETLGLKPLKHGYLACDQRLSAGTPGLWVSGDLRGGYLFTHTAWDDYRILKSQLLGDGARTTDRVVPFAVFIDPELGRVGMTATEARVQASKSGLEPVVVTFPYSDNLKALELRETRGFIKLVADPETEQLLGATVLGASASELVHLYSSILYSGLPYTEIRDQIMIHPTLGEAIQSATALFQEPRMMEKKAS